MREANRELLVRLKILGIAVAILGLVLVALAVTTQVVGQSQQPPRQKPDKIGPAWLVTVGPPPRCGPRCRFRKRIRRVARIQGRWQQTFSGTHETNPFGSEFQQNPPRDFLRRTAPVEELNRSRWGRPRWSGDTEQIREFFGDFSEFPTYESQRRKRR